MPGMRRRRGESEMEHMQRRSNLAKRLPAQTCDSVDVA